MESASPSAAFTITDSVSSTAQACIAMTDKSNKILTSLNDVEVRWKSQCLMSDIVGLLPDCAATTKVRAIEMIDGWNDVSDYTSDTVMNDLKVDSTTVLVKITMPLPVSLNLCLIKFIIVYNSHNHHQQHQHLQALSHPNVANANNIVNSTMSNPRPLTLPCPSTNSLLQKYL